MAIYSGNFETGVDGATVSTGDAGSVNSWSDRQFSADATLQYSNVQAYGALSCRMVFSATPSNAYVAWSSGTIGTLTEHWGRVYMWHSGLPNTAAIPLRGFDPDDVAWDIAINSSGMIVVRDAGGTTRGTGAVSIATGQWIRIEWHVVNSTTAGVVEAKLFNDADSTTPSETITSTGSFSTLAQTELIRVGENLGSNASRTVYMDNILVSTTGYPGPTLTATADFELGVHGSTVAAADPGSDTAWNDVTVGGGSESVKYDNTHSYGNLACKIIAAGGSANVEWTTTALGTVTDHYGRLYMWFDSNPSGDTLRLAVTNPGYVGLFLTTSGLIAINLYNGGGVNFTTPIALGQWVRLEWHTIHSTTAGQVEARLFNSPDSETPTETKATSASADTGPSISGMVFGVGSGTAPTTTFWLDNVVAGATSWTGPASADPYGDTIRADTPMVWWRLDNSAGAFGDSSGNGHTATAYGDAYDYQQPPGITTGYSIYNDTNSRAAMSGGVAFSDVNVWSLEAWFKTNGSGDTDHLLCIFEMCVGGPAVRIRSIPVGGKVELVKSFIVLDGESTIRVDDGLWHHLVVRRTGGVSTIWIDAVDRSGTMVNPTYTDASAGPAGFGAHWNGTSSTPSSPFAASEFLGNLDELAIYDYALSDAQILAHYQAGSEPPAEPSITDVLAFSHGMGMGKW